MSDPVWEGTGIPTRAVLGNSRDKQELACQAYADYLHRIGAYSVEEMREFAGMIGCDE